jgi:hypothetical protein
MHPICAECECHEPAVVTARAGNDRDDNWEDVPLCEEHAGTLAWQRCEQRDIA